MVFVISLHSILVLVLPYFESIPDSLLSRNTNVRRLALRVYYSIERGVSGIFRVRVNSNNALSLLCSLSTT